MTTPKSWKSVLIETLWNVKAFVVDDAEKPEIVLIETLWNVKELAEKLSRLSAIFLIETLWNVKQNTGVTKVVAGSV